MAQIDVKEVRGLFKVGETSDYKGNEVYALEILGIPVAYADAREFEENFGDCEDWEDTFATRLARLLAKALIQDDDRVKWTTESPTGREVHRL